MLKLVFLLFLLNSYIFAKTDLEKAKILIGENELLEAMQVLESIPKNEKTAFLMGKIHFYNGNFDEANEQFGQAINLNPNVFDFHLWSGHNNSKRIGKINFLQKGFVANTLKNNYLKAVELDSSNLEARISLLEFYLQAPFFVGGSVSKAKKQLKAIQKIDKTFGKIYTSKIEEVEGSESKAESILLDALKEFPKNPDLNFALANFYKRAKQKKKYFDTLSKISEEIPTEKSNAFFGLGMNEQRNENYEKAFEFFEKSIESDSLNFAAYYQFARTAIFAKNNLEKGRDYLIKYLQNNRDNNNPSKSWANYRLGLIYERLKDFENAKIHFKESIHRNPENTKAKKH